jgi:hypothetical protein
VRIVRTTAASALILSLAACSRSPDPAPTTPASSTTSSATGVVTGTVQLFGGPLNPQTGQQSLNGSPGPHWKVTAFSGTKVVTTARSNAAGRFRFVLPPGLYTLGCGNHPTVIVTVGDTVTVNCRVPIR